MKLLQSIVLLGLCTLIGAFPAQAEALKIGIRQDAKPFVFEEDGQPTGFLFDICKSALDRAGLDYEFVETTAGKRTKNLEEGGNLDMLCDPLTITRGRAGKFLFSPIVFISGGSFLFSKPSSIAAYLTGRNRVKESNRAISHDGRNIVPGTGKVFVYEDTGEEVAPQRAPINCRDLKPGHIGSVRIGVIAGSTAPEIIRNALRLETPVVESYAYETICYHEFDTHSEGITALCQGADIGDQMPLSYYFGDRDIIVAYYEALKGDADTPGPCASTQDTQVLEVSDKFFSTEPYGIAFSNRMDIKQIIQFQTALLSVFSELIPDPNNPNAQTTEPFMWFRKYFPGLQPSQTVRSVFSTLIVPER